MAALLVPAFAFSTHQSFRQADGTDGLQLGFHVGAVKEVTCAVDHPERLHSQDISPTSETSEISIQA